MRPTNETVRRSLFAAFGVCAAGGATVAALAVPSSPSATAAPDPCAASSVAKTVGSVANSTGFYLDSRPQTNQALTTMITEEFAPLLIGEDPRDIIRLWETLYSGTRAHYALREGRVLPVLGRRGITATVDTAKFHALTGRGRGRALLAYARDKGADLLVMGAYGHGELSNFLGLGGATAKVIASCPIPLLLAH